MICIAKEWQLFAIQKEALCKQKNVLHWYGQKPKGALVQTRNFIFETIKAHLRARGITYKDLSQELNVSEQTIKRAFATCDCSLERLVEICAVLHVELRDLIKTSPRPRKLIDRLTYEQEVEFSRNKKLLMVAICTMGLWTYHDMVSHLKISAKECSQLLKRLDEIGFIELRIHNRYRLLVAREFSWIVDGPIMRMVKSMAGDYFDHLFDGEGEIIKIINVRISPQSRQKLKASRLETTTAADNTQTTRVYDDTDVLNSSTAHSTNANGEAWTLQKFDAAGNATELQTAVYDIKKGLTDINSYKDGDLVAHVAVQGKATQGQLDKALALAEQMNGATSLVGTGKSEGGQTLLETLGVPDGGGLGETDVSTGAGSALEVSDESNLIAVPSLLAPNESIYAQTA